MGKLNLLGVQNILLDGHSVCTSLHEEDMSQIFLGQGEGEGGG